MSTDPQKDPDAIEVSKIFTENNNEFYEKAIESEDHFETLATVETAIFSYVHYGNEKILSSFAKKENREFQESLDLDKASLFEKKEKSPLPLYLKNYIELSFKSEPVPRDSLVIRIAKEGLKLASAFFESSQIELIPVTIPSTRSKDTVSHAAFSLRESKEMDPSSGILYQVIQENKDEAYLCINFSELPEKYYKQVNLRKNNRFIFSSQIDERGIVSFSGLKEGKYNVEFVGSDSAKIIDLTILVDHA
jgi:hypothetical protein